MKTLYTFTSTLYVKMNQSVLLARVAIGTFMSLLFVCYDHARNERNEKDRASIKIDWLGNTKHKMNNGKHGYHGSEIVDSPVQKR